MKLRKWKVAVLLATCSVILQAGGCGTVIAQLLLQQLYAKGLARILDAILGDNSGGTTTTP